MIWCICFFSTLVFLSRAIYVLVRNNRRFISVRAFVNFVCASFVLYLPLFLQKLPIFDAIIANVINTMQIISLDADFLEHYSEISTAVNVDAFCVIYTLLIGLCHVIVPIFALITAYECIVSFFSGVRLKLLNVSSSYIYVFSEMNDSSLKLALDISESVDRKAKFVFADSADNSGKRSQLFSRLNFYNSVSERIDSLDLKVKKNKNIYFFNISKNSDDNINNTLKLAEKYIKLPKEKQKLIHIYLFSDIYQTDTIIDSMQKGVLEINVINPARLSVYKLFDEQPLFKSADDYNISLLICGLDSTGTEALKAAIWLEQLVGVNCRINVVDPEATAKKSRLALRYPELLHKNYGITFYEADFYDTSFKDVLKKHLTDTTYAIVCCGDDEQNISTAIYLRRFFLKENLTTKKMPIIATYIDSYEKAALVTNLRTPEADPKRTVNYQIIPFGGERSVYSYDSIMDFAIDKLAINVHLAYEKIFASGEINILDALERYNAFEVNKSSNRANAMHIRYKLWLLGLDYTDDENAKEIDFAEYLTEKKLRDMTIEEHDRWMAFLRSEGWTSATLEETLSYMESDLSKGRHNCPLLLMHPYICNFDNLNEISEKLGLPDATVYDIKLIKLIPEILRDSTVNKCNYKIVKIKD